MTRKHWIIFVACQGLGAYLVSSFNVHSPIPGLFGLLVLFPGILIAFIFDDLSWAWSVAIAVPVNALAWSLFAKAARAPDVPRVEGS